MRPSILPVLFCAMTIPLAAAHRHAPRIQRSLDQCAQDGTSFQLPDTGIAKLTTMDDVTVRGGYPDGVDKDSAASISFWRSGHLLIEKKIQDMSMPYGFAAQSTDRRWLALNSSNGGASGGWSVFIFHLEPNGTVRDLSSSMDVVARDFSPRHNCTPWYDNYQAFQWREDDQLLLTAEVYGTGDCGKEAGYTEGYLLQPSTGKILHRYTEPELLHLPGVCLWNWDTRR